MYCHWLLALFKGSPNTCNVSDEKQGLVTRVDRVMSENDMENFAMLAKSNNNLQIMPLIKWSFPNNELNLVPSCSFPMHCGYKLCWTDANGHTFPTLSTSPACLLSFFLCSSSTLAVILSRKLVYLLALSCPPISHLRKDWDTRQLPWHYVHCVWYGSCGMKSNLLSWRGVVTW